MNYIAEYWHAIQAGQVIVPARVKAMYGRLMEAAAQPNGEYVFDEKKALHPIRFIERFCKHSKGEWAGRPVKLELFQKAFISALFGFVHRDTGMRQYKEAFFMVARKNGKSTMLAGIALFMMIADKEPGAEIYSTATKKDQARIIFDETLCMVQQSPELKCHVKKRKTDLFFPAGMSKFQPLGRNSDTLDGVNAHCVIMDELHGVKDRNL
jgi:phage terminase large subunit-like protein